MYVRSIAFIGSSPVLVDYSHLIECLNVYLGQDNYMRGDDALLYISSI